MQIYVVNHLAVTKLDALTTTVTSIDIHKTPPMKFLALADLDSVMYLGPHTRGVFVSYFSLGYYASDALTREPIDRSGPNFADIYSN